MIADKDTVAWKINLSNKKPVQIIINPSNYTINVNGQIFHIDVDNFTYGDQKVSTMKLNSFYINQENEETLKT